MSKKVKIPDCANPFYVSVNGVTYSYPAGQEVEVPDEVALVIEAHHEGHNKVPEKPPAPFNGGLPEVIAQIQQDIAGLKSGEYTPLIPVTQDEYDALVAAGTMDETKFYFVG